MRLINYKWAQQLLLAVLLLFPLSALSAEADPIRVKYLKKLTHCLENPPKDSGNAYANICYGETAEALKTAVKDEGVERLYQMRERYANGEVTAADVQGLIKDYGFFIGLIENCQDFNGDSLAMHNAVLYRHSCVIRRSLDYWDFIREQDKTPQQLFGS